MAVANRMNGTKLRKIVIAECALILHNLVVMKFVNEYEMFQRNFTNTTPTASPINRMMTFACGNARQ